MSNNLPARIEIKTVGISSKRATAKKIAAVSLSFHLARPSRSTPFAPSTKLAAHARTPAIRKGQMTLAVWLARFDFAPNNVDDHQYAAHAANRAEIPRIIARVNRRSSRIRLFSAECDFFL